MPVERIDERLPPPRVDSQHPAHLPIEVTVAEEVGQRELFEHGGVAIRVPLGPCEWFYKARRQDDVADPQASRLGRVGSPSAPLGTRYLMALTFANSNEIARWLHKMDGVRGA